MLTTLANGITELGAIGLFSIEAFTVFIRKGVRVRAIIHQMYAVGVGSLMVTVCAGLFVGGILAMQINVELRDFGAQGFLGGLSTSTCIRNIGPVLIGFLLSGKVGAYTSAELGTMKVTDQLNAIRCLGTNPLEYIILPRMVAVVLSSFLLLIIGLMLTIAGGVTLSALILGVNPLNYIQNIPQIVSGWSIAVGVIKSLVFGFTIAIISCYKGYTTEGGAAGVGNTVKSTSVLTLVAIVVADFSVSLFMSVIQDWIGLGVY